MKKLFMLLVLVGIAGAAGYIYWEKQAKRIEAQVAESIQRINAEIKAQSGVEAIEYKALSISGFPYSITLTLQDPVIRLPLSKWIRDANTAQNWVEEHRFTGALTLSADWKVTKYTLRFPIQRESVTTINNRPIFSRKAIAATPPQCSLSLDLIESFEHLCQPQRMLESLAQDASLLKVLECNVLGYQTQSMDVSAEPIQKADELAFTLHIDKTKGSAALDSTLDISIRKFQAFAASDAYFTSFLQAFPALIPYTHYEEVGLNTLAFLGEQNLTMQAKYSGEAAWPDWLHQAQLMIPSFQFDNGLGNFSGKIALSNQPLEGGTKREVTFDTQIHATIATLLEKLLQRRFEISLSAAPTMLGYNVFYIDTGLLPRAEMPLLAADLYPKLNALSPFDVSAKGRLQIIPPRNAGGLPQQASLALDAVQLHSKNWKMGLQGRADYNPLALLPTLDATLSIENGDAVFAQLADKLIMMEKWRQRQSNQPVVMITNPFIADLKRMVDALARGQQENISAEVATLGNPKFQIEFKNFMPRINGLDISQIMLLFNELLSTHLTTALPENHAQPPAEYQPASPVFGG